MSQLIVTGQGRDGSGLAPSPSNPVADSSGFAPPPPKSVYFGDMDDVLRKIADNVPIADSDRIYQWELESQRRVYLALIALGCVMVAFSLFITIAPTFGR